MWTSYTVTGINSNLSVFIPTEMPTRSEWIYSQGVYCEFKAGGEVWIFVFYNNKQTNKQTKPAADAVLQ